jgi:hypothetical protein
VQQPLPVDSARPSHCPRDATGGTVARQAYDRPVAGTTRSAHRPRRRPSRHLAATPGAMHDARSFVEVGLDRLLADRPVLGDLGFLGCGVQTPLRKPPGGELCELEKANNRAHAGARAPVERTIALFKQWRLWAAGRWSASRR